MPNRRTFDLVVIVGLLLHPAVGLLRMAARGWVRNGSEPLATIGNAVAVSQ